LHAQNERKANGESYGTIAKAYGISISTVARLG
jgi:hypothetical protein